MQIDVRNTGSIPGSRRSPGGGHGKTLQDSYLENPMDRGACRLQSIGVHRVWHDWSDLAPMHLDYTINGWKPAIKKHDLRNISRFASLLPSHLGTIVFRWKVLAICNVYTFRSFTFLFFFLHSFSHLTFNFSLKLYTFSRFLYSNLPLLWFSILYLWWMYCVCMFTMFLPLGHFRYIYPYLCYYNEYFLSFHIYVYISSVQSLNCVWLFGPHEPQHTSLPVHHQLPGSTQIHIHCVSDAIQPSHPLSSPSPPVLNLSQHQC